MFPQLLQHLMPLVVCSSHWDHKLRHHSFRNNREHSYHIQTGLRYWMYTHVFSRAWENVFSHLLSKQTEKRPTTISNSARHLLKSPTYTTHRWQTDCSEVPTTLSSCFSSKLLVFILQEETLWVKGNKTLQLINLFLKRGKKPRTLCIRKKEVTP